MPVVVIASFVDGADVPPDLHGGGLEVVLAAAMGVVAVAYAVRVARHPESVLRFLVGPVVWVGVAMAAHATNPGFSGGRDVARPQAWPMAITVCAIAVTALLARRSRGGVLADATDTVILPGFGVVVVLEAVAVAAHGWTPGPTLVTGLAALVVFELEAHRLGTAATTVLQAVALGAALVAIGPDAGWAWAAAVAVPAFLLLGEWWTVRRPCMLTVPVTGVAVGIGLLSCWDLPWPPVVAFGIASVWAHGRRLRPGPWSEARPDLLAAVLPFGFAAACFVAFPHGVGAVVLAAGLAAGALAVRATTARDDPFWSRWIPVAAVVLLTGITVELARVGPILPACAAALTGLAAILSTGPVPARVWIAAAAWAGAAALAFDASGVALGTAALAFAFAGVALVAVPMFVRGSAVGDVAVVGHAATVGAAIAASTVGGWTAVGALALCTAGWIITTTAQETRGSPVVDVLERGLADVAPGVPASVALLLLPLTAWAVLVEAGALARGSPWAAVVPAVFAFFDAVLARAAHDRVRLSTIAAWVGFLLVAGATVAAGAMAGVDDAAVVAIVAAIAVAVVGVIPAERRDAVMSWVAWAESGVVVVWGSIVAGVATDHLQVPVLAWGGVLTVYALASDVRTAGPRTRGEILRDGRFTAPLVLGVAGVIVAVTRAVAVGPGSLGWWALALAGLTLLWALELHEPWVLYASCSFATAAVALLLPWRPPGEPWGLLVTAFVLVAIAEVVTRAGLNVPAPCPNGKPAPCPNGKPAPCPNGKPAPGTRGRSPPSWSPTASPPRPSCAPRPPRHRWACTWALPHGRSRSRGSGVRGRGPSSASRSSTWAWDARVPVGSRSRSRSPRSSRRSPQFAPRASGASHCRFPAPRRPVARGSRARGRSARPVRPWWR